MHKLRWGILGVAKINNRLLPGFGGGRNADLVAIASRSPEKASAVAKAANIPVAHGSYEGLLADRNVDAVYIPLPNTLHGEWTRKAADAGKHVLCEKPLAPTAAEADAVVKYCRSKKVKLMDGFMWPHHARTARLRQLLDSGSIGEVRQVCGTFTFMLGDDPANIRLQESMAGGSLLDVGCYPVFGIRWAFGVEPVRAFATATMRGGVDLGMSGVLEFPGDRVGVFDCGFTLPLRQWLEISGTEGVVRVPEMWIPQAADDYVIYRDGRQPERVVVDGRDQIACMIEDFGRAVLQNEEPMPSPMEAVKTLKALDALARSAQEG
ncbi:MAG TPA: Gfo/Idh/MocA family oxidoreductase, partial [Gemmataceae bacterium]|nr:Gfo/Idh/MocA family oxidoreductase [Gemmataceae bacterium]